MKPIKISIKGFNSFVEEQSVNFEKLMSKGMFGIFGPTGSGKSTILDAITFALYGKIARESSSHSQYININSTSAIVVFEFEIEEATRQRYKITREIKKSKNGSTKTTQCKIVRVTNEIEDVLGEKERETTDEIKRIIGLEYSDFIKTVVLPQGSFNEFIKLEGKDRREILERLFNLQKYGKLLEDKISAKSKNIENEKNVLEGEINAYGTIDINVLNEQEQKIKEVEKVKFDLEEKKMASDKKFDFLKSAYKMQSDLIELQNQLDEAKKKEEYYLSLENDIQNSQKASFVLPLILDYDELLSQGSLAKDEFLKSDKEYNENLEIQKNIFSEFVKIEEVKNKEYISLLSRREKLDNLVVLYNKHKENNKLQANIDDKIKNLIEDVKKIEEIQSFSKEEIKRIDAELYEIDKFIKENTIDDNKKNNLTEAFYISQSIEKINNQILMLEEDSKKILLEKDKENENLMILQNKKDEIFKIIKIKEVEYDEMCKNDKLTPQYATNIQLQYERDIYNISKYKKFRIDLEKLNLEKKEVIDKIEEQQSNIKDIQKNITDLKIQYDELYKENFINKLKENMRNGDMCPLCNNEIQNIKHKECTVFEIDSIKKDLDKNLIKERELDNEISVLNEKKIAISKQIEDISSEFYELRFYENISEESITDKYNQEQNSIILQNELKENLFKELQKLNSLEEACEKEFILSKNNIENLNENLLKNDINLKAISKEKRISEDRILHLDVSIKDDIQKQLESIKSIEIKIKEKTIQKDKLTLQKNEIIKKLEDNSEIEKSISIDLNVEKEKLKNIIEINEMSRKELADNIGEDTNPIDEIEITNKKIKDIEEKYNKLKIQKEEITDKILILKSKNEVANERLQTLRQQAREKQNKMYEKIQEQNIFAIMMLDDNAKLKKLNEIKEQVKSWFMPMEKLKEKEKQILEYKKNINEKEGAIQHLKNIIGENYISEKEYEAEKAENENINSNLELISKELHTKKVKYEDSKEKLEKIKNLLTKQKHLINKIEILKEIKSVVGAKKFVEFIAMKQLKYVTSQATQRLYEITNGAYSLEVDDDGSFKIRDNKNGGLLRTVKTLSGGEIFVVSLSLALALSAQIQLKGVAPLELFFLDEGFGTLDDDLLEVVIDSLEKIKNEKLNVGVISHIEQLKQRIPVKLVVEPSKAGEGGSKVRIEYS